jgi:hypothetical protein
MRALVLGGSLVLIGCGGLSPQAYCEQTQALTCAKLFECAKTPQEQAAIMSQYGSQSDCLAKQRQLIPCDQISDRQICGGRGSAAWNEAAAGKCVSDTEALDCAALTMGGLSPSCDDDLICD